MTRSAAIAILSSRLSGAPNYADYIAWLERQSTERLIALAEGRPVHLWSEVAA